ncbi:MAG: hypothetical protein AAGA83_18325 [Cyanobacteria bacterium P01_F01_bin.116]
MLIFFLRLLRSQLQLVYSVFLSLDTVRAFLKNLWILVALMRVISSILLQNLYSCLR